MTDHNLKRTDLKARENMKRQKKEIRERKRVGRKRERKEI